MGVRQVLVHGLNVLGGILLARTLSPADFGVYAIVGFLLAFLAATSDLGLGAGLVRQPREPDEHDLTSVLAVQHVLTATMGAILWSAAPWLRAAYRLPEAAVWMFRVLALAIPVTAFQTVSSIRLERRLEFPRLAAIEVAQALVYNVAVVGLVWRGAGILSFALALLARSATGALLAVRLSPWPVGWRWDRVRIRSLLRFGIPYQGISFVSLLKDSITPVLVAALLGTAAVGYINWAVMVGAYPVLALFALHRVYLPSFARLQEHPEELARFVENVIRMTNAIVAPLAVVTLVLIEPITRLVFGEKWMPALPLFYLLWAANLFVPTATPVMGLLNALGRPRVTFGFAVLWMAGTWLLAAPLLLRIGALGFALANLMVQFSNLWLYRVAQRHVSFRILRVVALPWSVALATGLILRWTAQWHPPATLTALVVLAASALVLYGVAMAVASPRLIRQALALQEDLRGR